MKNALITIIIPVYNVKKYLKRCIDSVIKQSYTNLEILLIDDGSTDGSEKLCDFFAKEDKRIRVIHKENGGLSSARNCGLELMTGDFVSFLDSDDYLAIDFIESAYGLICSSYADISILKMKNVLETENEEITDNKKVYIKTLNSEKAIEISLYQTIFDSSAPGKLYKSSIFDEIRFPINKINEDVAVCHKLMEKASIIVFMNKIGYYYRQRNSSIMHTFNSNRLDGLEWAIEIESFCKQKYPKLIKAAKCRRFTVAIHLLLEMPEEGNNRKNSIDIVNKEIRRNRISVIFNYKSRIRDKAAAFLSFFGEKTLKYAWNSKFAIKK